MSIITKHILLAYLRSEFSFGFEIEFLYHKSLNIEQIIGKYFSNPIIKDDSDINNRGDYIAKEFASPKMLITPANIAKMTDFLNDFRKTKHIKFSKSCAFHIHTSYPNMNKYEWFFVICCLAQDKNHFNKVTKLKKLKFYRDEYADVKRVVEISDIISKNDPSMFEKLANKSPFLAWHSNVFDIHDVYGTLEWRGPRHFWKNPKHIINFSMLFLDHIEWLKHILEKGNVNGIPKRQFIKKLIEADMDEGVTNVPQSLIIKLKKLFNKEIESVKSSNRGDVIKLLFKRKFLSKKVKSYLKNLKTLSDLKSFCKSKGLYSNFKEAYKDGEFPNDSLKNIDYVLDTYFETYFAGHYKKTEILDDELYFIGFKPVTMEDELSFDGTVSFYEGTYEGKEMIIDVLNSKLELRVKN